MKDLLVLLVLLTAQTLTVSHRPYPADSDGCRDKQHEYLSSGLCCKKCPPGQRLNQDCSETTDSDCEQCDPGLHRENWNYFKNCIRCTKCKSNKGLLYARNCSAMANAKCVCQPGMYCIMDFDDPYCTECRKYKMCPAGYGVDTPGTPNSDVKCVQCLSGTFSNSTSHTDRCQPHTKCIDCVVVRNGTATSDTLCGGAKHQPDIQAMLTTATALTNRDMVNPFSVVSDGLQGFTHSTASVSEASFQPLTQSHHPTTEPGVELSILGGIIGLTLLLIIVVLWCLCKRLRQKDAARLQCKVDANGNTESMDKVSENYLGDSQLTTITVSSLEQQCLLRNGDSSYDVSQSKTVTEAVLESDCSSSRHTSIGPLLSTFAIDRQHCASFEPSLSKTELGVLQSRTITEPSSQPISQQTLSPVATSPHVNVNITLNIGNSSCGTPSVLPMNLAEENWKLPFGEEEESCCIPQQEDGKQSLMSVQEGIST